jgi:hypothetical protein
VFDFNEISPSKHTKVKEIFSVVLAYPYPPKTHNLPSLSKPPALSVLLPKFTNYSKRSCGKL